MAANRKNKRAVRSDLQFQQSNYSLAKSKLMM